MPSLQPPPLHRQIAMDMHTMLHGYWAGGTFSTGKHSCGLIYCIYFQRRYILRFATDGAVLTNTKNAVQGAMKLIPATADGKVLMNAHFPKCYDKEIILYYFIGKVLLVKVMPNHIHS